MENNFKKGVDFIGVNCVFWCHDGKGKFLLHKRSQKCRDEQGAWDCGGGSMEFGESPIDTIKREAREELGIEIGRIKFIVCLNMIKDGHHFVDISFTAEIISGEPANQEPDRIETIGWFPLAELPSPLFPPVQAVFDAIKTGERYFEIKEEIGVMVNS